MIIFYYFIHFLNMSLCKYSLQKALDLPLSMAMIWSPLRREVLGFGCPVRPSIALIVRHTNVAFVRKLRSPAKCHQALRLLSTMTWSASFIAFEKFVQDSASPPIICFRRRFRLLISASAYIFINIRIFDKVAVSILEC